MTNQTREWTEAAADHLRHLIGRLLWVEDGMAGHYTELAADDLIRDVLNDYAAGYDAGDEPQKIKVTWYEFRDGAMIDFGRYTWDYPIR